MAILTYLVHLNISVEHSLIQDRHKQNEFHPLCPVYKVYKFSPETLVLNYLPNSISSGKIPILS